MFLVYLLFVMQDWVWAARLVPPGGWYSY